MGQPAAWQRAQLAAQLAAHRHPSRRLLLLPAAHSSSGGGGIGGGGGGRVQGMSPWVATERGITTLWCGRSCATL